MKKSSIVIGLVVLAVIAMSLIGTYNRLVNLDNEVETQWAQIDNQLKRRADLIPNLVNTVRGFAAQ
ncbi:MAG: LemA family protein, partial [Actinomycetota bacterium]|nr:LemA family protein [Actinomycetota bacterium]